MNRYIVLFLMSFLAATAARADGYNAEVGYTIIGGDAADISIDLGALYGLVGYEWNHSGNYTSAAEAAVFLGVQDDDIFNTEVSLDPSFEVAYRGTFATSSPDLEFFWRASYANIGAEFSNSGITSSNDDSGFGIGVGATWRNFTLGYNTYLGDLEDFDRINFGFRFKF